MGDDDLPLNSGGTHATIVTENHVTGDMILPERPGLKLLNHPPEIMMIESDD